MNGSRFWTKLGLYGALITAWTATMGSLYFSEVSGFTPCTLCWYQRILMYPLAGLLTLGIMRRDPHLPHLILPFSLVGQGVAVYHFLLQKTPICSPVRSDCPPEGGIAIPVRLSAASAARPSRITVTSSSLVSPET